MFDYMKDKGLILVLLLVAAGLGIGLFIVNKDAADIKKHAAETQEVASNNVISAKKQLAELQVVNQTLETNLAAARADFSNKLAQSDASLRTAEANMEKSLADAKAEMKAQADSNSVTLAQRDQKISELESENQALDKEAASLRVSITNLQTRISSTQEKLAKSEEDRGFLLKELKILQSEKAEMERRFNTIADVRDQLHKLRTEAAIAQRLKWMREGIYATFNEKGGERLVHPETPVPPDFSSAANVELRQRGGVKIQTAPATNAPPK
jgi:chromosome segregation ATPase